jgi:hypothetical protein
VLSSDCGRVRRRGVHHWIGAASVAIVAAIVGLLSLAGVAGGAPPLSHFPEGWTRVVSDGFTDPNNTHAPFTAEFKGHLYVSTIANQSGTMFSGSDKAGGDIWRTKDGVTWEQIGEPGLGNPHNSTFRFVVFRGKLYAVSDNINDHGLEIWVTSDGSSFTQIEAGGFGDKDSMSSYPFVFKDRFIISVGNTRTGAQIWVSEDGKSFQQVVSGGMGDPSNTIVSLMEAQNPGPVFQGKLYAGVTNPSTGGEIWRTADGVTWERVADEGLGKSTNVSFTPSLVYDGQLYVVSVTTGGLDALRGFDLFRTADGTTWEKVASDGFNVGEERNVFGWLTEFDGRLFLTGQTMDPRLLLPSQPSERIPPKGFQLYESSNGADWTQVGQDGFGADSSYMASMSVIGGMAYMSVYDYHEGDQLWQSSDGVDWELIYREPSPSWFSEGGGLIDFKGHLLWLDNDLQRGAEIWRTDEEVVAGEVAAGDTASTVAGGPAETADPRAAGDTGGDDGAAGGGDEGEGDDGAARSGDEADGPGGVSGGILALIIVLAVVAAAAIATAAYFLGKNRHRSAAGGASASAAGDDHQPAGFCSACGTALTPGSGFCSNCGKRL